MQHVAVTWNSLNINDNNPFNTTIPTGQLVNLSASGVTIPRAATFPYLAGKVLGTHNIILRVMIAPTKDIPTNRELLKAYFNIQDDIKHNLVINDITDLISPGVYRQWYLSGLVTQVREQSAGLYFVTIQLDTPVWKLVTPGSTNWNVTASGQTQAITVLGNINVQPVFSITPTVAKTGGLSYRRWIPIYNPTNTKFTAPLEITGGGLDTATLVTAVKMQSDGDDLRVWLDGVEVDRWLSGMNGAATKCWINFSLLPGQSATTSVSIAGAGAITTISLTHTRANLAFLQAMANALNKVVIIGTEAFTFTGVNVLTYQLTGVTRTAKGTSIAAHAAPATLHWIEHDLWIYYGDSTLSAPDTDDRFKPIHDLSSVNTSLSFTNFFDENNNRPFAWLGEVNSSKTGISHIFTGDLNTHVNPSTKLGLALINSSDATVRQQETGQLDWIFTHPSGITNVAYALKKYMGQATWPSIVGLQVLQAGVAWLTAQNEDAPTIPEAWQSASRTVALGGTYYTIRFSMDGSISQTAADIAAVQYDTLVLTISSANLPVISVNAEQSINFLNLNLTNNTTTEYLQVNAPVPVNTTLVVDCENKLAYLSTGERVSVLFSTFREPWLDLRTGSNTLQFDDTGTNAVTVVVSHRDMTM